MLHNNSVNVSDILSKCILLKTCIYIIFPIKFFMFCSRFCYEKCKYWIIFKSEDQKKNFLLLLYMYLRQIFLR